jgi:hypothetical protein
VTDTEFPNRIMLFAKKEFKEHDYRVCSKSLRLITPTVEFFIGISGTVESVLEITGTVELYCASKYQTTFPIRQ